MQGISSDIIIVFAGTFLLLCIFGFVFYFVIAYNKRHREYLAEKEEIIKSIEQQKLQSQIEIQEQILKVISGEIHDNIGQILSLISLQLNSLPTTDEEKLEETILLLDNVITDLRGLSKSMDPDRVMLVGITEAIAHELKRLERTGKYSTQLYVDADFVTLSADKTIILYRIFQEIINNIIKHSKANNVVVTVGCNENDNFLIIDDNGIGFNVEQENKTGLGLSNITQRAKLIGAQAEVNSLAGSGTTIKLIFSKNNNYV